VECGIRLLGVIQNVELGVGNSLGDIFLADRAVGNGLEGLHGGLSTLADGGSRARKLDGEETSIGVSEVRGGNRESGGASGCLGKKAVAR
jgi:hypothetical protein